MKLNQLRKDFNTLDWTEQLEFVRDYVLKRDKEISHETIVKMKTTKKKKSSTSTGRKKLVTVSDEQLELLKELGLV